MLFIHNIVARQLLGLARRDINFFPLLELGNNAVHFRILISGLFTRARDDQRGAGFVNQDRIHFVHDGEIMHALHAIVQIEFHVVAQVVESELVVGTVGHVGCVGITALLIVQIMDDNAYRESEEAIQLAHPLRVAFSQIIVNCDDMDAASTEGVEVDGQRRDQRLTFSGLHFGDLAGVQHHASNQLHIEMPHVQDAATGLAHDRESLHQNLV